jgi:hypothetical protein
MKRSSDKARDLSDQLSENYNLASIGRAIVRETPDHLLEDFYKHFINLNRDYLEMFRLPWFIPEWLGGLGLPKVLPCQKNSDLDLRIAGRIVLNWGKERPIQLTRGKSPWHVRELAKKGIPDIIKHKVRNYQSRDTCAVEEWDKYLSIRTIDLLFNSDIELKDLYRDDKFNVLRAINHNRDLWSPKGKKDECRLGPKLSERVIEYSGRYEGLTIFNSIGLSDSRVEREDEVSDWAYFLSEGELTPSCEELQREPELLD